MPELRRLLIADEPAPWERAGFSIEGRKTRIGSVGIRFVDPGHHGGRRGFVGWELTGIDDGSIDGLLSIGSPEHGPDGGGDGPGRDTDTIDHPNRVSRLDHVVINTPDVQRTIGALRGFGFSPRRTREVPGNGSGADRLQVFLWAGEAILEVVGPADAGTTADRSRPAQVWGLALTTDDMDAAVEAIGPHLTAPKTAVQPGRRIATVKTERLGITLALALMTPHDPSAPGAPDA